MTRTIDKVLYVGAFTGIIVKDRMVKLKYGILISSLDTQQHKFIKINK